MRNHLRLPLVLGSFFAIVLAACSIAAASNGVRVDDFASGSLAGYTVHNTPGAWSVADGWLNAADSATQSVVIRRGATIRDGWVETETDHAADGGLVLRFQDGGAYYLLAIRDDSYFGYANLEIYRADDGRFVVIGAPIDVPFPRGARRTVRFEAMGTVLRAYLDGNLVMETVDNAYAAGGFGLRHDNTRRFLGITSRFDLLRWRASTSRE